MKWRPGRTGRHHVTEWRWTCRMAISLKTESLGDHKKILSRDNLL
jgi:hypothetical protein